MYSLKIQLLVIVLTLAGGRLLAQNEQIPLNNTGQITKSLLETDSIPDTLQTPLICNAAVPTAFSPNGDGENDVLYVRGFNVATLKFKLFNRYGEQVFKTEMLSQGWDGTYLGAKLNTEVFYYVLVATCPDNTKIETTGSVTLLR